MSRKHSFTDNIRFSIFHKCKFGFKVSFKNLEVPTTDSYQKTERKKLEGVQKVYI